MRVDTLKYLVAQVLQLLRNDVSINRKYSLIRHLLRLHILLMLQKIIDLRWQNNVKRTQHIEHTFETGYAGKRRLTQIDRHMWAHTHACMHFHTQHSYTNSTHQGYDWSTKSR